MEKCFILLNIYYVRGEMMCNREDPDAVYNIIQGYKMSTLVSRRSWVRIPQSHLFTDNLKALSIQCFIHTLRRCKGKIISIDYQPTEAFVMCSTENRHIWARNQIELVIDNESRDL